MREQASFDYAIIRLVPRVDREEFVNAGAIVFCAVRRYLEARVHADPARLLALWPDLDLDPVLRRLDTFPRICAGVSDAGPIARLPPSQRFQWLVAPRSTIIQVSAVHTGISDSPEAALDRIFRQMVGV